MKVSIIIPVFNVSEYIERCIKSVMNQTYSDIECLIVDDATLDDSIEKCERLIVEYKGPIKFSILHHQKNRGLSAARNTGTARQIGNPIRIMKWVHALRWKIAELPDNFSTWNSK